MLLTEALAEALHSETRHVAQENREDKTPMHDPIYIRMLGSPFHNWIISLEDIHISEETQKDELTGEEFVNMGFDYSVARIPLEENEENIILLKDELQTLLSNVLLDIMEKTLQHLTTQEI